MLTNDQIIERLIQDGCDVPGALPRFIGNRDFYCRMLALVPEEENFSMFLNTANETMDHAFLLNQMTTIVYVIDRETHDGRRLCR